jgi:hypothetical protein
MPVSKIGGISWVFFCLTLVKKVKRSEERKASLPDSIPLFEDGLSKLDSAFLQDKIDDINGTLKTFTCFIYHKGKYIQLPDTERCHFFTADTYIFLCIYQNADESGMLVDKSASSNRRSMQFGSKTNLTVPLRKNLRMVGTKDDVYRSSSSVAVSQQHSEEETDELTCAVYFWQGRHCSKLALSTFRLKTQLEMETLVQEMYDCNTNVIYLDQHSECFALLAHLENMLVYHSGTRQAWLQSESAETVKKSSLYQIKKDLRYSTLRAVEVNPSTFNLISNDYFFLHTRVIDYLWVGAKAARDDLNGIQDVLDVIQSLNLDPELALPEISVVKDGFETEDFWQASEFLEASHRTNEQGKKKKKLLPVRERKTIYTDVTRFIQCSCALGYFAIKEISFYSQNDLVPDSAILIMTASMNYCWTGSQASQVVINRCLKLAESLNSPLIIVKEGEELIEFKAIFHAFDPVVIKD